MDASTPDRMVIRRTTPHGDRRRRVVIKEPSAPHPERPAGSPSREAAGEGASSRAGTPRRYAAAAQREAQPRTCDWIPTRPWSVVAWFAGLSAMVVVVGGLHLLALEAARRWQLTLSSLLVDGGPNVAGTVQATFWLLAAGCCRQTLRFRRHRVDDYRGRYRVWYPFTALTLLLGIDAMTGLSRSLSLAAPQLQETLGVSVTAPWVQLLLLTLATLAVGRLAAELWTCRPAVASLGLACGMAWSLTGAQLLGWIPGDPANQPLFRTLAVLVATQAFAFALLLNLRYVFLDAQGELPVRDVAPLPATSVNRAATSEEAAAPASGSASRYVPAATSGVGPTLRKASEPPRDVTRDLDAEADEETAAESEDVDAGDLDSGDFDDAGVDESGQTVSLSRAERKRQRKMQQKQKRAA